MASVDPPLLMFPPPNAHIQRLPVRLVPLSSGFCGRTLLAGKLPLRRGQARAPQATRSDEEGSDDSSSVATVSDVDNDPVARGTGRVRSSERSRHAVRGAGCRQRGGPDGVFSAHPSLVGKSMKDLKDKAGKPIGEEFYKVAQEGKVAEVSYVWPRPGSAEPVQKVSFVTKVGDQVCAVGYYK